MSYGMRFMAMAGALVDGSVPPVGAWVRTYDVEAYDGRGTVDWTTDPAKALRFDSAAEAITAWRSVSIVRPRRSDGKPNRPLTAMTVSIEEVPE